MALYIVRNVQLGTAPIVDADGADTAARAHAHGVKGDRLESVSLPGGGVALYVLGDDGERAGTRALVTAVPVTPGERGSVFDDRAPVTGWLSVDVYTRGADGRSTYQGSRGWTRDGNLTPVYHGDATAVRASIMRAVETGDYAAPADELPPVQVVGPPRLPRDRKREQTFATGAVARDNHGSYSVAVPTDDGTGESSRHPSRVRSRALTFARSVWGSTAHVTDRAGSGIRRTVDGEHVHCRFYSVVIVDPADAYRHAAGGGMYSELPLP